MDDLVPKLLTFPPVPSPAEPLSESQYDQSIRAISQLLTSAPPGKLGSGLSTGEDIFDVSFWLGWLDGFRTKGRRPNLMFDRSLIHPLRHLPTSIYYAHISKLQDLLLRPLQEIFLQQSSLAEDYGRASLPLWKDLTPYKSAMPALSFERFWRS